MTSLPIAPPETPAALACPHFPPCPGCPWIPVGYAAQLERKHGELAAALAAVVPAERIAPLVPSPQLAGYRNQSRLVFARGQTGRVELGLYAARSHRVVPIPRCPIQPEGMNAIARAAGKLARDLRILVYDERTGHGLLRYLSLRTDHTRRRYLVGIVAVGSDEPRLKVLANGLRSAHPEIVGITLHVNATPGNVIFAGHNAWTAGEPRLADQVGRVEVRVSIQSFLQANHPIAGWIAERIADHLAATTGVILDLYGGVGVMARHLVGPERVVVGVESAPHAVADAEATPLPSVAGVSPDAIRLRYVTARVEQFLADPAALPELERLPLGAAVVNPPRAGLSAAAIAGLLRLRPPVLAYVSCRPASLARDLALLAEHYEVVDVLPADMLPLTPHIEALALLRASRP